MITTVDYRVNLYLDGNLIGDVRELAEDLTWAKRRTATGVDEIDFTLNDHLFDDWLQKRGTNIQSVLKPMALDCKIFRNGEAIVGGFLATMPGYKPNGTSGGFLATMPGYKPNGTSADLDMRFDGYLNLLNGVYIRPTATRTMRANLMVASWISDAETRAMDAGKRFGITEGESDTLAVITRTFDGYKPIKEAIVELCDNVEGAGQFDVIFDAYRQYTITQNLGRYITGWHIDYPTSLNGKSATSISANEVQGFASHVIEIGAGETSADSDQNTAIVSEGTNYEAVSEYGYAEVVEQNSSISTQSVLAQHQATKLANTSNPRWEPEIELIGRQVPPSPTVEGGLWIGDTVELLNNIDLTGQTNGRFRINELVVKVSASNAETITPKMERVPNEDE